MPQSDPAQHQPPPGTGWNWWFSRLAALADYLRNALGTGIMRAASPSHDLAVREPLRARAILGSAKIEERYSYSQEISQNPDSKRKDDPAGEIELILPFDGHLYFTRQAHADVAHAWRAGHGDVRIAAGYLTLTGYERTDLDDLLGLSQTYDSMPIEITVPGDPGQLDRLIADRSAAAFRCAYLPATDHLKAIPVDVAVSLIDPDSAGWEAGQGPVAALRGAGLPDDARVAIAQKQETIMQQIDFRPDLLIQMTVESHVPAGVAEDATVKVAKVKLGWPTVTSLRELSLRVNGHPHHVQYNPVGRCLEWSDVPMTLADERAAGDMRTYVSSPMSLSVPHPGELYQEESLSGLVEVEMDRLLSGMDARLYRADGFMQRRPQLQQRTQITADFTLILDDAFTKRLLTLYQQLHFDEVVPSGMRVGDIRSALVNRGFAVLDSWQGPDPDDWWLNATRSEGPDDMELLLYVAGVRHKASREWKVPGGVTYRSRLDSGEIRIYIYGALPRNSQPVVHEVNALRRALHERFAHLPARR